VINMSWGTLTDSRALRQAIQFAANRGIVLVTSAGNMNDDVTVYPAVYPGVVAVAATDDHDRKAEFSNYGRHIDVDAPGVNVISAYPGGYYSPIVAGQAALVRSVLPSGVESRIGDTAVKIDDINWRYAGQLGTGRVDMLGAVRAGEPATQPASDSQSQGGLLGGLLGGW
jgi:hypothetical protein